MNRLEALSLVIRETRLQRGLSQEKLAELARLHRNSVGLIERNLTALAVDSLFAIADALDVPASVLLAKAEEISANVVLDAGRK